VDIGLEEFADKAVQYSLDKGAQYCDVRAEIISKNGFIIENGQIEHFANSNDLGLGIRILAKGAWGFFSVSNPKSLESIKNGVADSLKSAIHFSDKKKKKVKFSSNWF
jgi:TldD protein